MPVSEEVLIKITTKVDKALKDIDRLNKKVGNSAKASSKAAKGFGGLKIAFVAVAAAAYSLYRVFGKTIKEAVDLEEATSKFNVVFQDVAKEAQEMASIFQESYGLSQLESQKLLSDTGDLLTGFGMTGEAALDMSSRVNALAVDLASFTNIQGGSARASRALTKGLLGEREMLKELGIVIHETAVKEELRARGQEKLTGQALLAAKAEIVLSMAMAQSHNAMGDYARTANNTANVMRRVKARTDDLSAAIGKEMLPGLNDLGQAFLESSKDGGVLLSAIKFIAKTINKMMTGLANVIRNFEFISKRISFAKTRGALTSLTKETENFRTAIVNSYGSIEGLAKKAESGSKSAKNTLRQYKVLMGAMGLAFKQSKGLSDEMLTLSKQIHGGETDELKKQIAERQTARFSVGKKILEESAKNEEKITQKKKEEEQKRGIDTLTYLNMSLNASSEVVGQISSIFNQLHTNQLMNLDIEQQKKQSALDKDYEQEKERINVTIKNEKERDKALLKLDEDKKIKDEKLTEKYEKKKRALQRKIAKQQKAIAIVSATINTAQAVSKALAQGGFFAGPAFAAIVGALGAAQIALIAAQPLPAAAQGGLIKGSQEGTILRAGEGGKSEAIIPLENDEAMEKLPGGNNVFHFNDCFFANEEWPSEVIEKIDRGMYKLNQDNNSTFAEAVI